LSVNYRAKFSLIVGLRKSGM